MGHTKGDASSVVPRTGLAPIDVNLQEAYQCKYTIRDSNVKDVNKPSRQKLYVESCDSLDNLKHNLNNGCVEFSCVSVTEGHSCPSTNEDANLQHNDIDIPRCVYFPRGHNNALGFRPKGGLKDASCLNDISLPIQIDDKDFVSLAKRVIRSGISNCDGLRVPLPSTFNLLAWRKYAPIFGDFRLVELLAFGFPIGLVNGDKLRRQEISNHNSATSFPTHVHTFLTKEAQNGAIAGPFAECPLHECHISPLMSRPKDGDNRCIILDLSYGGESSVNGSTPRGIYDGFEYDLKLPNLDALLLDILSKNILRFLKST